MMDERSYRKSVVKGVLLRLTLVGAALLMLGLWLESVKLRSVSLQNKIDAEIASRQQAEKGQLQIVNDKISALHNVKATVTECPKMLYFKDWENQDTVTAEELMEVNYLETARFDPESWARYRLREFYDEVEYLYTEESDGGWIFYQVIGTLAELTNGLVSGSTESFSSEQEDIARQVIRMYAQREDWDTLVIANIRGEATLAKKGIKVVDTCKFDDSSGKLTIWKNRTNKAGVTAVAYPATGFIGDVKFQELGKLRKPVRLPRKLKGKDDGPTTPEIARSDDSRPLPGEATKTKNNRPHNAVSVNDDPKLKTVVVPDPIRDAEYPTIKNELDASIVDK